MSEAYMLTTADAPDWEPQLAAFAYRAHSARILCATTVVYNCWKKIPKHSKKKEWFQSSKDQ